MSEQKPEIRILGAVQILNGISVSGEENMARLVTVIRELKDIANGLHKHEDIQLSIQEE